MMRPPMRVRIMRVKIMRVSIMRPMVIRITRTGTDKVKILATISPM